MESFTVGQGAYLTPKCARLFKGVGLAEQFTVVSVQPVPGGGVCNMPAQCKDGAHHELCALRTLREAGHNQLVTLRRRNDELLRSPLDGSICRLSGRHLTAKLPQVLAAAA